MFVCLFVLELAVPPPSLLYWFFLPNLDVEVSEGYAVTFCVPLSIFVQYLPLYCILCMHVPTCVFVLYSLHAYAHTHVCSVI